MLGLARRDEDMTTGREAMQYSICYWQEQADEESWGGYVWKEGGAVFFRTNAMGRGLWIRVLRRPWHQLLSEEEFALPPAKMAALDKLLKLGFHVDHRGKAEAQS